VGNEQILVAEAFGPLSPPKVSQTLLWFTQVLVIFLDQFYLRTHLYAEMGARRSV
jgi:hypothetical protein